MSELWDTILRGKEETRRRRAALSFEEKIAMVEKMRDRDLLIKASGLRKSGFFKTKGNQHNRWEDRFAVRRS